MDNRIKSLRPFIGAKNFDESRSFYRDLGFTETKLEPKLSVFQLENTAFYLQDYYAKDWVDNTMLFLEVNNVERYYEELKALNLSDKYSSVRLQPIRVMGWGSECFLHDPSGILWHIGQFNQ
ncbi:VOC family protein [uncultured Mucilaginibacter sp.]|uniref:VOC family protein n=1 Tax=uncultured Mucilaginibacter sp. TaxID=797541 RepID=UPI0025E5F5AC|nr:VOC family protein [uncultured Mucilaginibacter sp.]